MEIGITLNNQLVYNKEFSKKYVKLEKAIGNIKRKNKRLYKILVLTVAVVGLSGITTFAAPTQIVTIPLSLASFLKEITPYIIGIGMEVELSNCEKREFEVIVKYILIYAIFLSMPYMFNIISKIINGGF